ncbi:TraK family protein [Methylomonas sp. AM2-LC]|uniref:TraK family protein n=1 Tax=Methylomonas sp. AM2-LC TaxID=3153301 RepID=UPI0032658EAE
MKRLKLSERVQQHLKEKKGQSVRSKNRTQFLNVVEEVEEALAEGCTAKHIWETLHKEGHITFSYETFRLHVNNLQSHKQKKDKPAIHVKKVDEVKTETKVEQSFELPSFKHNPVPNIEDLY